MKKKNEEEKRGRKRRKRKKKKKWKKKRRKTKLNCTKPGPRSSREKMAKKVSNENKD